MSYGREDFIGDFSSTPVYGFRAFDTDNEGRLTGVTYPEVWSPKKNEATCLKDFLTSSFLTLEHMETCNCGFYAFYSPYHVDYIKPGQALGFVKGTGNALVGPRGFRSSRAQIMGLVYVDDPDDLYSGYRSLLIQNAYAGLPMFDSVTELTAHFSDKLLPKIDEKTFFKNPSLAEREEERRKIKLAQEIAYGQAIRDSYYNSAYPRFKL